MLSILLVCTSIFFYAQDMGAINTEPKYTDAQLDSLGKIAYLKRMASEEAAGLESVKNALQRAKEDKAKEISIVGFTKNELPDFSTFTQIETFSCERCRNLNIEKLLAQLAQLPNLKQLTLASCNIKTLPSSIENLKNLEKLNLKDNLFRALPSLSNLKQLKTLNLEHCGYLLDESVWDALHHSNLENLNFSASEITEINGKIGNEIT